MKVELINLYFPSNRVKYMLSSYVLKAYFDKNSSYSNNININVSNFSSNTDPLEIYEHIKQISPRIVAFSCYVWNIELVNSVLHMLENEKEPIIILGGPEMAKFTLDNKGYNKRADYIVFNEGEIKLQKLIEYIFDNNYEETYCIPEVAYYDSEKGKYVYTDDTNKVDLTKIPLVYSENIIPKECYDGELVFLETQRGCKYKCKYCTYHHNINGVSYYSINDIKKEIEYLLKHTNITSIRIIDADFASNIMRAKDILKHFILLKEQGHNIKKLLIEYNYYDCDYEFLKLIAELKKKSQISKLKKLDYLDKTRSESPEVLDEYTVISGVGIQSFSNESLRAISRKPMNMEEIEYFFETCKSLNIVLKIDIILALPLETEESYISGLNTVLEYIKDTDHVLQLSLLQILPGSDLEKLTNNYGLIYSHSAPYIVLETNSMQRETLGRCTKITALVSRIINSPLRTYFFETKALLQISSIEIIEKVHERIIKDGSFESIKYCKQNSIDDEYWGGDIYVDLPSEYIYNVIKDIRRAYGYS